MWSQDVGEAARSPESEKMHMMRGGARERRGRERERRGRAGERESRGRGGCCGEVEDVRESRLVEVDDVRMYLAVFAVASIMCMCP